MTTVPRLEPVNIHELCRVPAGPMEVRFHRAVVFLAQGTFSPVISLLFGMGFAVPLIRSQERGRSFVWFFLRWMTALFRSAR